jgi:hypothetical protein
LEIENRDFKVLMISGYFDDLGVIFDDLGVFLVKKGVFRDF